MNLLGAQGLTASDNASSDTFDPNAIDRKDFSPVCYPHAVNTYDDDVTDAMEKLAVHRDRSSHGGLYPSVDYGVAPFVQYPPPNPISRNVQVYSGYSNPNAMPHHEIKEELGTSSSPLYPPPNDPSETSCSPVLSDMPIFTQNIDVYPPYLDYQRSASSSGYSQCSLEKECEVSSYTTTRGIGATKEKGKGHHSHMPYGYEPPPMYGGGYPSAYGGGYPPLPAYPSAYGPLPQGYPPAPAYPPAPHSFPSAPYGYPLAVDPYSSQPYPAYELISRYPPPAYGTHAPYPMHHGHVVVGYAPGAYVGQHLSSKHSKHYKHHKLPKHSMYQYSYLQPHYVVHGHHHKHKKHKFFGKGLKFKKFKMFKKLKF